MLEKKNNESVVDVPLVCPPVIKFYYERRSKKKEDKRLLIRPVSFIEAVTADIEATSEDICELHLGRKEDKMAGSDGNKVESSVGSSQEKGSKNKRKLADHFQRNPDSLPSSLTEFPWYEQISEETQNPLSNLQSSKEESSQSEKDPIEVYQSSEWDDPYVRSLEELLSASLQTLFKGAIKRIVECGYSEDVAFKFISRHGIYSGGEDLMSSIVYGTLATLKKKGKKRIESSREEVFESFQQMVDFTMLEMINVLREVKPFLSVSEAIWWLIICDLNISQACAIEGDLSNFLDGKEVSGGSSSNSNPTLSKSDALSSKTVPKNTSEPHCLKPPTSNTPSCQPKTPKFGSLPDSSKPKNPYAHEKVIEKSISSLGEQVQSMSLTQASEERSETGRNGRGKKGLAAALRQKSFHGHNEKTYKNHGKGSFTSEQLSKMGAFVVEHRYKVPSKSIVVHSKGDSPKISREPRAAASSKDINHSIPTSSQLAHVSDSSSTLLAPNSELAASSSTEKINAPKTPDYYAGIPFDESLGKYVSQNTKDEIILKLVPQRDELQKEANNWTEWTNQKVIQVARRLSLDQPELKALRKEKQEAEKSEKQKQIVDENIMKRLSDIESALNNSTGEVKKSNSTIHKLEVESSKLKHQMAAAQLHAAESAVRYQETIKREQKALKNSQTLDTQRALLQEKLETERQKATELKREIVKAKNQYNEIEARFNKKRMEKEQYLSQAAAIKREREQLEAAVKVEEEKLMVKAEKEKKLYLINIKHVESRLSLMKYRADTAKIATLREGFGGLTPGSSSSSATPRNEKAVGGLRWDRECVMCLSEEKSVVFLPCAHQVLCPKCNELHEKQGMDDCPSCRAPIQRRINVIFPPPRG
ncbi:hypothetical protein Ddye_003072 [Dipteronia dyeriana]|uniref:RING-type domain-containing protein n=1 Tax=Dipteronia dyeriana TaxID=168575 RepID=A0AAE0CVM3_9ROSI|nr:hypothetical protein Ddye_003072 [Dipteronia dyeriana]